ncbi:MAG: hypothetical protein WDN27_07070 [Candidatus Saccharibacteria bacterium]
MKRTDLHRHQHPIHWHGSMFVAIAAILLTSFKCSDEMLRALRAVPVQAAVMDNVYMRDVETGHSPIILNIGTKHASYAGK